MLPPRAPRAGTGAPRGRPPALRGTKRHVVTIAMTTADFAILNAIVEQINQGGKHREYNATRSQPQRGRISRSEAIRDALADLIAEEM